MNKEIIERLKNNKVIFDLLDKEEQECFKKVTKTNCLYYTVDKDWVKGDIMTYFMDTIIYRIKPEYQENPDTFTTTDGVEIKIGIDKCYAINIKHKRFELDGNVSIFRGNCKEYRYFVDKVKAECYLALLKDEDVEIYDDNNHKWIPCIYKPNSYSWDKDTYRIKPKETTTISNSIIDFTKIKRICIIDSTGRVYDKTFDDIKVLIQDDEASIKLVCDNVSEEYFESHKDLVKEACLSTVNTIIKEEVEYEPYSEPNPDLKGKWIKVKDNNVEYMIVGFDANNTSRMYWAHRWLSNEELFRDCIFLNGSVIGQIKKVI